jgi:predicted nucleic acid-binding protein
VTVVVDASVAVAWYAEEGGTGAALTLAATADRLLAPAFLALEIGNALARKANAGLVPPGFAIEALRSLRRRPELVLHPTEPLIEHAAALAERLPHPIYDCLYLALAQREGATLATFDARLRAHALDLSIPLWPADHAP